MIFNLLQPNSRNEYGQIAETKPVKLPKPMPFSYDRIYIHTNMNGEDDEKILTKDC